LEAKSGSDESDEDVSIFGDMTIVEKIDCPAEPIAKNGSELGKLHPASFVEVDPRVSLIVTRAWDDDEYLRQ
jgi:hypothetical protein